MPTSGSNWKSPGTKSLCAFALFTMAKKFSTHIIGDVVASTLKMSGNGMKVVCEVSCEAADAGLVRTDEDIVVVGGTSRGADTAVVIRPVSSQDFFDLKIKEILCKPRL